MLLGLLILASALVVAPLIGIALKSGGVMFFMFVVMTVGGLVTAGSSSTYAWMRRS